MAVRNKWYVTKSVDSSHTRSSNRIRTDVTDNVWLFTPIIVNVNIQRSERE
jgi:hypothetical protein